MTNIEADLLHDAMAIIANARPLIRGEFLVSGDALENGTPDDCVEAVEQASVRWMNRYHEYLGLQRTTPEDQQRENLLGGAAGCCAGGVCGCSD